MERGGGTMDRGSGDAGKSIIMSSYLRHVNLLFTGGKVPLRTGVSKDHASGLTTSPLQEKSSGGTLLLNGCKQTVREFSNSEQQNFDLVNKLLGFTDWHTKEKDRCVVQCVAIMSHIDSGQSLCLFCFFTTRFAILSGFRESSGSRTGTVGTVCQRWSHGGRQGGILMRRGVWYLTVGAAPGKGSALLNTH